MSTPELTPTEAALVRVFGLDVPEAPEGEGEQS